MRFTLEEAQKAGDEWRFNCGPGALCAVLDMTPSEIRPLLGDFESKGYTNPTLMTDTLTRAGAKYQLVYRNDEPFGSFPPLQLGLMRVQWSGPWTRPGVPMRVRYRYTHWIAARGGSKEIFDINAMCAGGWLQRNEWVLQLAPWLRKELYPKSNGMWITHALEVVKP
jgi:hypothetical protein